MKTNRILKSMLLSAGLLCCSFASTQAVKVTVTNDRADVIGIVTQCNDDLPPSVQFIDPGVTREVDLEEQYCLCLNFDHVYHPPSETILEQVTSSSVSETVEDGAIIIASEVIKARAGHYQGSMTSCLALGWNQYKRFIPVL